MCGINVSIFLTIKGPVFKRSPLASSGGAGWEDEGCNLKCKQVSLFLLRISKYYTLYNLYVQFLHKCTEFQPHDWLIIYFGWQVVEFYLMKLPGVWQKPVWMFAHSVASHFPIECIPFDGFSFFFSRWRAMLAFLCHSSVEPFPAGRPSRWLRKHVSWQEEAHLG